ncbi:MAG: hypothetical protein ACI8UD_001760 [Planctomycetota bacterium]|jgi:hypothetical protein
MNAWNCLLLGIALAAPVVAQGPKPGVTADWGKVETRIAWHGTWTGALAAAANHKPKAVDTRRLRRQGIRNGVQWQAELTAQKGR